MNQLFSQKNYRLATLASLALMLIVMLWVSKDFGITGDALTQHTYGKKVLAYFATGGADKSALVDERFNNQFYYGGFYDMVCAAVCKVFPGDDYTVRNYINAFFGWLAMVVVALLARHFRGWGAALMAAWLLFLSPRFFGECMNNPKDLPFALGMAVGVLAILRLVRAFPAVTWKHALFLAVTIGFTISVRVGGLLLIPYLLLALGLAWFFSWRKGLVAAETAPGVAVDFKTRTGGSVPAGAYKRLAIMAGAGAIGGYILGIIFWPYALQNPLSNPFTALEEMSKFGTSIRMLYDGHHILSTQVPATYIPKYISITSPIIVLAGIVLSLLTFVDRRYRFPELSFLFFAAIFPMAYVVYKHSALYDGWRHLLFVYPPLVVLATLGFFALKDRLPERVGRLAVAGLVILGLIAPVRYTLANHPHEIVYFNAFVGGVDGAFGRYETDYYMNSLKAATYRLAKMKNLAARQDSVVVATNCVDPVAQYLPLINPRIKTVYVRYAQRYDKDWEYGLFYSRFLDKGALRAGAFPPGRTIAVEKACNTPLVAIVERGPKRPEVAAAEAMARQDFPTAIALYQQAIQLDPKNETAYPNYAIALANTGQMDGAITAMNKALELNPDDLQSLSILAKLYAAKGDMSAAQQTQNKMQDIQSEEEEVNAEEE